MQKLTDAEVRRMVGDFMEDGCTLNRAYNQLVELGVPQSQVKRAVNQVIVATFTVRG